MKRVFDLKRGGVLSAPSSSLVRTTHVVTFIFVAIVVVDVIRSAPSLALTRSALVIAVAAMFAASFLASQRWRRSSIILLAGLCGCVTQLLLPTGPGFVMAIVALIRAARLEDRPGRLVAAAIAGAYLAAYDVATPHVQFSNILSQLVGLAFAYLASAAFRRLIEEKAKTEELLQQVLAGQDAQIRAAALEERNRLAREIHDILAHTLSALTVQLESTRLLAEQRPGDPATLAAIERAAKLAREGLQEGRRAVGMLRGEVPAGTEALARLTADFQHDSGIPCRFAVEGHAIDLPPDEALALYRTTQEALTNILKHAEASRVEVRLRYGPEGVELTVENDGGPKAAPLPSGGHGLMGLRERAELAHGSLEAGATARGFRVHLRLPA